MLRTDVIGIEADEVRMLATEGFLFGAPLVAMDLVRRAHTSPCARFVRLPPDPAALAPGLPRGGGDTLFASSAWLDLAEGPLVLSLPDLHGRYAVVALFDAWGRPLASLGSRTVGGRGRDVAVVGPDWRGELQGQLSAVRSPSRSAWATLHLWANGAPDLEAARELHRRFFVTPLLDPRSRPPLTDTAPLVPATPLHEALAALSAQTFFHRLAGLLAGAPPAREERTSLETLALIGVRPGQPFECAHWPEDCFAALVQGLEDGRARLAVQPDLIPGWRCADATLRGAGHRLSTLGAPPREDILSLVAEADDNGRPLDGSHRYELRFDASHTPPAEAFWSLEVLGPGGAPQEVEYGRAGLSDRGAVVWGPNQDLHVPIQRRRPARDSGNWLVTPTGAFSLRLQMCWPRGAALDGGWAPPRLKDLGPARGASTVFTAGTRRRARLAGWAFAAGPTSMQGGM
jgi:hypothetical protein